MKNKFCDSTWVGPSSENLCFLLPDHHLAEHVAGTEEILKGNLVGVPPKEGFALILKTTAHRPGRKM